MLEIKLNEIECNYLFQMISINDKYRNLPLFRKKNDDGHLIKVSADQADDIRDLCGEQLQIVGFDQRYELTQEGKILESLIDKFFIG